MTRTRVAIMTKAPLPGLAKTRLIPSLGAVNAAKLAERMLVHTLTIARDAAVGEVELCMTPAPTAFVWRSMPIPETIHCSDQGDGDLGDRLARVAHRVVSEQPLLLIGTDCPDLTANHLRHAATQLLQHDAYLIPVADGGYALLGLRKFDPHVFQDIHWSSSRVCEQTLQRCADLGWKVGVGPVLRDIDEPDDLRHLPAGWSVNIVDA